MMFNAKKLFSMRCSAKISGYASSVSLHNRKFKSGFVKGVETEEGHFYIRLNFTIEKDKSHDFMLWDGVKSDITRVMPQAKQLILQVKGGANLFISVEGYDDQFPQFCQFVQMSCQGKYSSRELKNGLVRPVNTAITPIKELLHQVSSHNTQEENKFTQMKSRKSEDVFGHYADKQKENSKDNGVAERKVSFLTSAVEKSRTVQALTSPSGTSRRFYGNCATEPRNYARRPLIDKRLLSPVKKPGLLYSTDKRQLLSNVNNSITYSWGQKSSTQTTPTNEKGNTTPGLGFSNLGNTCYMNSILQSLLGLPMFTTDLMTLAVRLKTEIPLHSSLAFQMARLHQAKKKSLSRDRQADCLASVKNAVSSTARRFSGHDQHDAHELLSQMLDQMKEDVARENKAFLKREALKKKISTENSLDRKPDADNVELAPEAPQSEIHDVTKDEFTNPPLLNFEFEVLHTITCLKCEEEVKKTETFNDLSLDMPKRPNADVMSTIQDALNQFFQCETIEYTCENGGHKEVSVSHQFYRLPRILVLHLKRYQFSSMFANHRKLRRDLAIPRYLTLYPHTSQHTYPPYALDVKHPLGSTPDASLSLIDENSTPNKAVSPTFRKRFTFKESSKLNSDKKNSPKTEAHLKDKTSTTRSLLRKALLNSNDNKTAGVSDNEVADPPVDHHNKTFTEIDYSEYTGNMSEEDQIKKAMEMSLQDSISDTSYLYLTQASDTVSSTVQNLSVQTLAYPSTPNKQDCGDLLRFRESAQRKRRSQSRITSDSEDDIQSENSTTKKARTSSPVTHTSTCTVTKDLLDTAEEDINISKGPGEFNAYSDMLNALDADDRRMTPLKNASHVKTYSKRSSLSSSTPKRFDTLFATCDAQRDKVEQRHTGNTNESIPLNLNGLEEEFRQHLVHKPQDLDRKPKVNDDSGCKANKVIILSDNETEMTNGHIVQTIKHDSLPNDDTKHGANTAIVINGEHYKQTLENCESLLHKESSTADQQIHCHLKQLNLDNVVNSESQAREEASPSLPVISAYFSVNETVQNDIEAGNDVHLKREETCVGDAVRKTSPLLNNLPRHVFDPSLAPRLSDTCFNEGVEDENANVKPSPSKQHTNTHIKETVQTGNEEGNCQAEDKDVTKVEKTDEIDDDLKKALQHSMTDQEFDEDMKKAIALSLKDLTEREPVEQQMTVEEESFIREEFAQISAEEVEKLEHNLETGELPYSYRLMSVVSHLGTSNAGHYISDVYSLERKMWYSYDDSHVTKLSEECVRESRRKTGYIFFYVSKDLVEEFESRRATSPGSKENQQHPLATPTSGNQGKKPSCSSNRALQPLGQSNNTSVTASKEAGKLVSR